MVLAGDRICAGGCVDSAGVNGVVGDGCVITGAVVVGGSVVV